MTRADEIRNLSNFIANATALIGAKEYRLAVWALEEAGECLRSICPHEYIITSIALTNCGPALGSTEQHTHECRICGHRYTSGDSPPGTGYQLFIVPDIVTATPEEKP
jgi:hypothetical protein